MEPRHDGVSNPGKCPYHGALFALLTQHAKEHVIGPAFAARVDGIGVEGGRFTRECATDGRMHVATLLRGRRRVNAADASHGRASRAVEVPLAKDEPAVIRMLR